MQLAPWWVTAEAGCCLLLKVDPVVGAMMVGVVVGALVGVRKGAIGGAMAARW